MGKTVLVVDDDKSIQKLLAEALGSEGFNVIVERDGRWALNAFEKRDIDFVILDVLIPIHNGFEVAKRIRATEKGKKIPILMISGIYRSYNNAKKAKEEYGVVDYLDKPLKLDKLLKITKEVFGDEYPKAEEGGESVDSQPVEIEIAVDKVADEISVREKDEVEVVEEVGRGRVEIIRGNLRTSPFPELLAQLHRQGATGALLLRNDKVKKIVYFKEGQPVFVKSNLLNECLGRIMVKEGMITEEECERSIELMKKSKRQQGTILIELNIISPHNLVYALERQLEIKLYDIFSWTDGEYQFNPRGNPPGEITTLDANTANIIYEGIKRKYTLSRVEAELAPYMEKYAGPSSDPLYRYQGLNLFDDETSFLEKIDGTRKVRVLVSSELLKRDTALKLLYALKCADMLRLEDAPFPEGGALKPPMKKKEGESATTAESPAVVARAEEEPPPRSAPPPLPTAGPPSLEDRQKKQELTNKLITFRKQNYYEILGISRDAQTNEIKRAFYYLAHKYHPDKQGTKSLEIKKLAREVYKLLYKAHETLINPAERKAYDEELATGIKRDVEDDMSRLLAAEGQFQQGERLLKKKLYTEAAEAFAGAIDLYAGEGEFHAYYGWALYLSNPRDKESVKKAKNSLSNAISLNPKLDTAYVYLGHIYKALGMQDLAEQQYEKAIQCNPDNSEALRELKLGR